MTVTNPAPTIYPVTTTIGGSDPVGVGPEDATDNNLRTKRRIQLGIGDRRGTGSVTAIVAVGTGANSLVSREFVGLHLCRQQRLEHSDGDLRGLQHRVDDCQRRLVPECPRLRRVHQYRLRGERGLRHRLSDKRRHLHGDDNGQRRLGPPRGGRERCHRHRLRRQRGLRNRVRDQRFLQYRNLDHQCRL